MKRLKAFSIRSGSLLVMALTLVVLVPTLFALSWTCPYCRQSFNADSRYPSYFNQWKQLHMSQCPKQSSGGGSVGGSGGAQMPGAGAMNDSALQLGSQLGTLLGKLLFGDPQAAARQRDMSTEAAKQAVELEHQRLIAEIKEKQNQYDRLASVLMLDKPNELVPMGFDGDGRGLAPMDTVTTNASLRPAGSSFFGLGGGRDAASADPEARQEQDEFERMNAAWMTNQTKLIQQRLQEPNPWCNSIYTSLKTKEPPPPGKAFDELQPGDVLLISPDDSSSSKWIRRLDRFSSQVESPASHALIYLKEVNGKKLFLDNVSGAQKDEAAGIGPHIITGEQYLKIYGQREANVATLLQPLKKDQAARLWTAAREMGINELSDQQRKSGNWIDKSGFGLYGNDNMVCSEASRWALIKAGRWIPGTRSPLKKLAGVEYGPVNFYTDDDHFLVTPLR